MKSMMVLAVLIPALLLSFGMKENRAFAKSPAEPKLFLPETTYEFGEIHEGEDVQHHFIMKNKGTSPLEIIDVKTD